MFMLAIINTLLAVFIEGAELSMGNDGIFGHLSAENFVFITFFLGFIAGVCGTIAVNFALEHFPLLLILNLLQSRPIIAMATGIFLGIDLWPGWMTCVGTITIFTSMMIVNKAELNDK
tara:strand:+ start:1178 stop:1531 length:354 start_codon:yes stop_codon:yes gene_type:complete